MKAGAGVASEEERAYGSRPASTWACGIKVLGVALILCFALSGYADDPMSAPVQDFVVVEARGGIQGFRFHDLLVLDPANGRILNVLPMSPRLPEALIQRADDRLRLFPIDQGLLRTVVAPLGQTVVHSRTVAGEASSRRVHSYVWRMASGELSFTLEDAYGFALLGEDGAHLAVLTKDKDVSVTEFQVWDIAANRMIFKARFPEAEHVRAHRTNAVNLAVFSLDDGYLMVWDQRQRNLRRIAMPDGRQLDQLRDGYAWSMQQGAIALSADERWLAFLTRSTRQQPLPGYYLVDLDRADPSAPLTPSASGVLHDSPFAWVSFGSSLLGMSATALHRVALSDDSDAGSWAPRAWVAQGASTPACAGTSTQSLRACAKARELERARRAFLPPGAMLEAVDVLVRTRYVASNDARLLVAWDGYNGRPIILDASVFPPREISPDRPDGADPAALYEIRPGFPLDEGARAAPGMLRFSHYGSHLVSFEPEAGATSSPPVELRAYSTPDLVPRPMLNPSLGDYLRARRDSQGLKNPALCRLEPAACHMTDGARQTIGVVEAPVRQSAASAHADLPDASDVSLSIERWMRRDPSRARTSAPELCKVLGRIQRPIQGEPYFIDGHYQGIRIAAQAEIIASDPAVPFRDGDIVFDGGWCSARACSADAFGQAMKQACASRRHDLIRNVVLEVGSIDPERDRIWIMMEKP